MSVLLLFCSLYILFRYVLAAVSIVVFLSSYCFWDQILLLSLVNIAPEILLWIKDWRISRPLLFSMKLGKFLWHPVWLNLLMAFHLSNVVHLLLIAPFSELSCRHECTVPNYRPSNETSHLKILRRLLGWSLQQGRIQGQQVRFPVFLVPVQINIKVSFQRRNERPVRNKHLVSPSLEVPKVIKHPGR